MATYISVNDPVVNEGAGFIEFTVKLSAPSTSNITVNYTTADNTASYGYSTTSDYIYSSGTLTFAAGVTSQVVRIAIGDDKLIEALKSFNLHLTGAVNAVVTKADGFALIVDNDTIADTANPAHLSVRDVVVDVSSGTATFVVLLDKATTSGFNVDYSSAPGSAAANRDYTPVAGSLSFAAGETVKTVTVNLLTAPGASGPETFSLNLGAVTGPAAGTVQVADGSGQALIGNHGQTALATPNISISNPVVGEGGAYVDFVVSLNAPGVLPVTVNYATNDGTASYGYSNTSDYIYTSGTLVFAPGVTTQTVRVPLGDDNVVETLGSFKLQLTGATNATLSVNSGTATIVDNDTLADTAHVGNLSMRDVIVDVKTGIVTFSVILDKAVSDTFSVDYGSVPGSATANKDYIPVAGNLTFAPGETAKTVTVNLLDSGVSSLSSTFKLNLGAVTGRAAASVHVADGSGEAVIGPHGQTPVATPSVNVSNPYAGEHDGYVDFMVSLSGPATAPVTVNYATNDGTAAYGYSSTSDYVYSSGSLTFAVGETTKTVRVIMGQDNVVEPLESFTLRLTGATNAVIGNSSGLALIADNNVIADTINVANLSVHDITVDAKTGLATFDLVLDKATTDAFSIAYSTANGTASAGTDYLATSGSMSFGPGETSKTVTVSLLNQPVANGAETFTLNLGGLSGAAAATVHVSDGVAQATIGSHGQSAISLPTINISNPTASRADGYAEFVVTLNSPGTSIVNMDYATRDGTASYGYSTSSDYIYTSGSLAFAPGVTTQVVRVPLGSNAGGTESFSLHLTGAINGVLANADGTATLVAAASATGAIPTIVQSGTINAVAGNQNYDGLDGIDTAVYAAASSGFTVTRTNLGFTVIDNVGNKGTDQFFNVERLHFSDKDIGLDIDGTGGQAYRLYQAAFNRVPDQGGLGFQMHALDIGYSLSAIAKNFIDSPEFASTYGNLSNTQFVTQLYANVLHRAPDSGGLAFHVGHLDTGLLARQDVLAQFSESPENQVNVIGSIQNGFAYVPFVG